MLSSLSDLKAHPEASTEDSLASGVNGELCPTEALSSLRQLSRWRDVSVRGDSLAVAF